MAVDNLSRTRFEHNVHRVLFLNKSGEEVPPYAAMIVDKVEEDEKTKEPIHEIRKCEAKDVSRADSTKIVFNMHYPIADTARGFGTFSSPGSAAIEGATGDVVAGDIVGIKDGSWKLEKGGVTYVVKSIETIDDNLYAVVALNGLPAIAEAVSVTGCGVATVQAGTPRTFTQKYFTAKLTIAESITATQEVQTPSEVIVTVANGFKNEPAMAAGQDILIAQRADGIWTILRWECEE